MCTTFHPAITGEAWRPAAPIGEAKRSRSAKKEFYFSFLYDVPPLSRLRITGQIVFARHKVHERIGTALVFQKSPTYFAVLTGNGNMFSTRCRLTSYYMIKNNVKSRSPRLIPNDWRYFLPTLVLAGHYLWLPSICKHLTNSGMLLAVQRGFLRDVTKVAHL